MRNLFLDTLNSTVGLDNTARRNSTIQKRYDFFALKPPEDDLQEMWLVWSVVTALVAFFCFVVLLGIVSAKHVRSNSFNVFLIFLILPDAFFSANCAITCSLNYVRGDFYSRTMCEWQSWYVIFDFTTNAWLNAAVARQMHKLLVHTFFAQRFKPPSLKDVYVQISLVYVYSAIMGVVPLLENYLPLRSRPIMGLACMPVEYSVESTIFFWLVFVPAFMLIPLIYTMWVCWDVYKKSMLPVNGDTRVLYIFFMRLAAVFVLMWLPSIVIIFAMGLPHFWLVWFGGTWSHLQGFVSTVFILSKPDIRKATMNLITCRFNSETPMTPFLIKGARTSFDGYMKSLTKMMTMCARINRDEPADFEIELEAGLPNVYPEQINGIKRKLSSSGLDLESEVTHDDVKL